MVRRAENPDKKSPVDTASLSEEKLIIAGRDTIIKEAMYEDTFFESFSGILDLVARLIQDNGKSEEDAYSKVAAYYTGRKQFDQAVEYFEKMGDKEMAEKCRKQ
jgi:hypothetical protein